MPAERGTAPLSLTQRLRKREIDRQSQQRIRERRNAALYDAERVIDVLRADIDRLAAELRQAHLHGEELEAENRVLRQRIEKSVSRSDEVSPADQQDRDLSDVRDGSFNLPPIASVVGSGPAAVTSSTRALAPFPFHSIPPRNEKFDCLSDDILANFLKTCRLDTTPPAQPDLTTLLFPRNNVVPKPGSVQSLAKILTDLTERLPSISELPEQIANHYVLYKISVWRLACKEGLNAKETYDALPEWLRPLPIQMLVNHAPWMDHMPWPSVRSHLIDNQSLYDFDNFSTQYTSAFSVNWPYGQETTVLSSWNAETATDEVTINPAFERHIRDLSNWSITGMAFKKQFPALSALAEETSTGTIVA